MANLFFVPIRSHPGGTLNYIANRDKMISGQSHDVYNVLNYMGEPESVQRVYTYSRHCSPNPKLAETTIALHQQRYYQSKNGAIPKEGELLGLHFIVSFTIEDNPPVEVMSEILQFLAEHPLLRDYATLGAHHFDKPHRHSHFYTSQFSAVGKPRKMALQYEDIYELMRYCNKLCVERGLSIIDNSELRKDKEYSDWIDSVIAEGKVTVHPEQKEKKKRTRSKKSVPTKNHYYRWMMENQERTEEENRLMTEKQRQKKNFEEKRYYTPDGNPNTRWYVTGDPQNRFYTISRIDTNGYKRTELDLAVRFVLFIAGTEGQYIKRTDPATWVIYHAKVAKELQHMYDYVSTATKMNIEKPEQITARLADVGKQMNVLKQEKSRHEKSIIKHEQIMKAYETYTRVKPLVEDVQEPEPEAANEYKSAYTILAQHQVLTVEAYTALRRRYDFEKQKCIDYDRRIPELKRQYHDLKKLESLAANPVGMLRRIYGYSLIAYDRAAGHEVDTLISDAHSRTTGTPKRNDRIIEH